MARRKRYAVCIFLSCFLSLTVYMYILIKRGEQRRIAKKTINSMGGVTNEEEPSAFLKSSPEFLKNLLLKLYPLKVIEISFNSESKVNNLYFLESFKEIEILYLPDTKIKGLEVLAELKQLKKFGKGGYLDNSDIKYLSNLENLEILDLTQSSITSLNELLNFKSKKRLKEIYLGYTMIDNIDALKGFKQLEYLSLPKTEIKEIDSLKELTNLKQLLLHDTKVNDIKIVENLSKLEVFWIGPKVTELKVLENLQNLKELNLEFESPNINIEPLKKLHNLKDLGIFGITVVQAKDLIKALPRCEIHLDLNLEED